ncbi:MAG: 1-deoxy-D-xylulose-5-phosphate reductoisomerase, partial [Bacteroidales bacterium]
VIIADESLYNELKDGLNGYEIIVQAGSEAIADAMMDCEIDTVVTAMVGYSGLEPTINAIKAGKRIALANKETLVVAGELITDMLKSSASEISPVDSEHSAIFQSLVGEDYNSISKLILTASGGPFRLTPIEQMQFVTKANTLNHPNWVMGAKITVDSATMMNKGFEMIEAKWLFGIEAKDIEIVVHPQSIVHSMVEFNDGSIKAQLGVPDMHLPIQYALGYPNRLPSVRKRLSVMDYSNLTFEAPSFDKFPMLTLAYDSINRGGNIPCALNAANEIAVAAFLEDKINYIQIADVVANGIKNCAFIPQPTFEDYVATNAEIRNYTNSIIK